MSAQPVTHFCTLLAATVILLLTLREVFRDLFLPSGSGALSGIAARVIFNVARKVHWLLPYVGPLSIVLVIVSWVLLFTVGFALIYFNSFPQAFQSTQAEATDAAGRSWAVLYYSLACLTTLGTGSLSPARSDVRLVSAVESLIGMGLVTASVTWIVLLYPALGRMRALVRNTQAIMRTAEGADLDFWEALQPSVLSALAAQVVHTRIDFIHFPLIYYFHSDVEGVSFSDSLLRLDHLARSAVTLERTHPLRFAATTLQFALADIAETMRIKFVDIDKGNDRRTVFKAVQADHLRGNADPE